MVTVDLVWFNAGGGHRAAALALEAGIQLHGLPWRVRRIDLTAVLDPTERFRRITGIAPEDLYNKRLASGFTLGLAQELRLLQAGIRLTQAATVQRLAAHWRDTRPDLVVSLIPNFNRALHDALALARPGVPFVTVMTDLADHPPHFWVEPDLKQHVVCPTAHAQSQALAAGCAPRRVHRVDGVLLREGFHRPPPADRAAQRTALGLPAEQPVGLVLFGGTGSRTMRTVVQALPDTPLVVLCGHNAALAEALRRMPASAPRIVLGHTGDVARWMHLADFFIGKPGPGSLSEAVQCGLPVVVTRNAFTMPQERWNTDWVRELGLGVVLRGFGDVAAGVGEILGDLEGWRQRVRGVRNRALFEVPALLQSIVAQASGAGRRGTVGSDRELVTPA